MKGGVVDVMKTARLLYDLVMDGVARPGLTMTKEYVGLDQAPEAYRRFDHQQEIKVFFKFPWHEEQREEETSTDDEDTVLGREHDDGGGEIGSSWSGQIR
ncbi:hypothetical protein diail_3393 [Diaporthe ilicicola]|nr:hypothetical protein diail_3393 [Diaporthe ilicicola]